MTYDDLKCHTCGAGAADVSHDFDTRRACGALPPFTSETILWKCLNGHRNMTTKKIEEPPPPPTPDFIRMCPRCHKVPINADRDSMCDACWDAKLDAQYHDSFEERRPIRTREEEEPDDE